MFPTIQIGPLSVQAPGLILIIGIWLGLFVAEKLAPRFHASGKNLYDLIFIGLVSGIVGARLSFALQEPSIFQDRPLNLLSLTPSMLDPTGGAAVALIAMLIYGNRKKIALWSTLDALTPFLAVMSLALSLSHLASGNAYGVPTSLPWGIQLWGAQRHPTQIYEIIAAGLILGWICFQALKHTLPTGRTISQFVALTAGAQLLIMGFRGDQVLRVFGLRGDQVAAWFILGAALIGMRRFRPGHEDTLQEKQDDS
jgi:prolipoprotein diacylglyceryltransferase